MSNKKMSAAGIGPVYVGSAGALTLLFLLLDCRLPGLGALKSLGWVFIALGVVLWLGGAWHGKILKHVEEGTLATEGVYRYVRNPIYSAFTFLFWGLLLCRESVFIFLAVPLYWVLMTVLLKKTEEKWLLERFGEEYRQYCSRVNRVIPWFS